MMRLFKDSSFSKRMLAGGILGPILSFGLCFLLFSRNFVLGECISIGLFFSSSFALSVVIATYYWRIGLSLISRGIKWLFNAVFGIAGAISFDLFVGIPVYTLSAMLAVAMALLCVVVAVVPLLALPFGSAYLIVFLDEKLALDGNAFYLAIIAAISIAYLAVVHFLLPLRGLRR